MSKKIATIVYILFTTLAIFSFWVIADCDGGYCNDIDTGIFGIIIIGWFLSLFVSVPIVAVMIIRKVTKKHA